MSFTCLQVAKAARLRTGKHSNSEHLFHCPNHDDVHPSLSVNSIKNVFLCGPCRASGTAWQFVAFIGRVDPSDKPAVYRCLNDLGLSNGNHQKHLGRAVTSKKKIINIYSYVDEIGQQLFEVVRYEPKDFRQRRLDGKGGYIWNLENMPRVPYRLPDVLKAVRIFWVEGEKDVDALNAIGITATTSPMGALAFRPEYAEHFKPHQHVIIIPDNDDAGRDYALTVAAALAGKVASVRILELRGLPSKGDVSDWLVGKQPKAAAAELTRLAETAPDWKLPEEGVEEFIEFAPSFLTVEDPPVEYIHPEITPQGVLKCSHGDPRTMKSLAALEEAIAAATATPAFGMERFRPARAFKVLYSSQEDAAPRVRARAKALLRGRGIADFPETLAFAVHKGIDLDSEEWRDRLFNDVMRHGFELIVLDPIRTYTAQADKGPSDVIPIAKFLRRFIVNGITVHLVHHDTKPPTAGPDTRRRSHRASGGGWFSVSECPVAFEKIGESQSLVIPEDFKFSSDPKPFTIRYSEEDSGRIVRLIGEDSTAEEARALALDQKVLVYVTANPGSSGNAIAKGVHARKEAALDALNRLFNANKVDFVERGKGKYWTPRRGEST